MRRLLLASLVLTVPVASAAPLDALLCGLGLDLPGCFPLNGGFERCTGCVGASGEVPDGWRGEAARVAWYLDDARSGRASVRLAADGSAPVVSNRFPVAEGAALEASAWHRTDAWSPDQALVLEVRFFDGEGSEVLTGFGGTNRRSETEWARLAAEWDVPAGAETAEVLVACYNDAWWYGGDTSCDLLADDVRVTMT